MFIVTVALAGIYFIFSFRHQVQTSKLAEQSEALARSKAEYEKRIQDAQVNLALQKLASETVQVPVVQQNCFKLLGQRICTPVPGVEHREIARLPQVPDTALKRSLDDAFAALKVQSQEAVQTTKKINELDMTKDQIRMFMAPIISVILLCASLYIIISGGYKGDGEKWAFGSLGTILGFWLR